MGSACSSLQALCRRVTLAIFLRLPDILRLRVYKYAVYRAELCLEGATDMIYMPHGLGVTKLPLGLFMKHKYGPQRRNTVLNEAAILRHIARYGSPLLQRLVPRVIDLVEDPNAGDDIERPRWYLVITEMPGQLPARLFYDMEVDSPRYNALLDDFRGFFRDLRSLPPPSHRSPDSTEISIFNGAPLHDFRIQDGWPQGPFADVAEFHESLVSTIIADQNATMRAFAQRSFAKRHRVLPTHCDLNLKNFLVTKDGRLSAIIDWESCSYLPEYWELTSAVWHHMSYTKWKEFMQKALPGYEDEFAVEWEMWCLIVQ